MNFYDELLDNKSEDKTYPEITAPGLLNAIVKEIWDKEHQGMSKVEYMMGETDTVATASAITGCRRLGQRFWWASSTAT